MDIHQLKQEVDELKEDLNTIVIINGGGNKVRYERKQFHQKTYDVLHFKGVSGWIIKALGVLLIILQILNLLK
jgi:uridylate kinase